MMKRMGGLGTKRGRRRARRRMLPPRSCRPGSPVSTERETDETMAVKLRLMRVGKTKQPSYRVVAADCRSPRDGRFIEIVGQYNPRSEPSVVTIDNDKALKWLRQGAQPTERVQKLLEISGAWAEFKGAK